MVYGQRLKELRSSRKLSQQELTDRLKINRSTYARYETEATQPDFDTLMKIAKFYGVSTDYLLGHTVEDKNITMIAGNKVDLSRFDERQLKILEWAWERKGLSAIDNIEDLEKQLEEFSVIYDFLQSQKESRKN